MTTLTKKNNNLCDDSPVLDLPTLTPTPDNTSNDTLCDIPVLDLRTMTPSPQLSKPRKWREPALPQPGDWPAKQSWWETNGGKKERGKKNKNAEPIEKT